MRGQPLGIDAGLVSIQIPSPLLSKVLGDLVEGSIIADDSAPATRLSLLS